MSRSQWKIKMEARLFFAQSASRMTNTSSPPEVAPPSNSMSYADLLYALLSAIPEYRASLDIDEVGLLLVTIVGSLANGLALLVLATSSKLRHIAMYNYMAALAVVDTSVLVGPCLIRWLLTQDVDIRARNTALCRFLYFQSQWSFAASAWILVAMTLDRFVAISFPLRARLISTPKRAWVILGVLAIVLTLVNSHFFFTLKVHGTRDVCVGYESYDHFLQKVWPWIDATIYSFAPFFFLTIFNVLIIINHRRYLRINATLTGHGLGHTTTTTTTTTNNSNNNHNGVNPRGIGNSTSIINSNAGSTNSNKTKSSSRRLTILLFTVTFSFMVLTAPRALLTIIRHDVFDFTSGGTVDFHTLARYSLTGSLVNLLMFANHGVNFFLYCLTGNTFRQQLALVFTRTYARLKRATSSKVAPSSSEITTTFSLSLVRKKQSQPRTVKTKAGLS